MGDQLAQGLFTKIKSYLAIILLQFGYAGMNIITMVSLKQGMSHFILVVYRHAVATLVIAPFTLFVESTNATSPPQVKKNTHDHHLLSDKETTFVIIGGAAGLVIFIFLCVRFYLWWSSRLPRLSIAQLESFPTIIFPSDEGTLGYGVSACEICQDDFTEGLDLRVLPSCGHVFHTECAVNWLHKRHATCPVCRFDYSVAV